MRWTACSRAYSRGRRYRADTSNVTRHLLRVTVCELGPLSDGYASRPRRVQSISRPGCCMNLLQAVQRMQHLARNETDKILLKNKRIHGIDDHVIAFR